VEAAALGGAGRPRGLYAGSGGRRAAAHPTFCSMRFGSDTATSHTRSIKLSPCPDRGFMRTHDRSNYDCDEVDSGGLSVPVD
jgi:hypothetical protein